MSLFRRTRARAAAGVKARRSAPFRAVVGQGKTVIQYTPAKDRADEVYYLAVTPNRLLWYWDGDPADVRSIPYALVRAFGFDPGGGIVALRVARMDALSSELAAGDLYDEHVWQLYPSPMSAEVLAAMVDGIRQAGTLEPAQAALRDWAATRDLWPALDHDGSSSTADCVPLPATSAATTTPMTSDIRT
jgi:hypothetical protein